MKEIAKFFKVLSDEARLKMIWLLLHHHELCVCDLMAALEITQSKTSRHLAALRHAGLVKDRRLGAWSYYALKPLKEDLKITVLKVLKSKLSQRPGAQAANQKLEAWLKKKHRHGDCDVSCARLSSKKYSPARVGAGIRRN